MMAAAIIYVLPADVPNCCSSAPFRPLHCVGACRLGVLKPGSLDPGCGARNPGPRFPIEAERCGGSSGCPAAPQRRDLGDNDGETYGFRSSSNHPAPIRKAHLAPVRAMGFWRPHAHRFEKRDLYKQRGDVSGHPQWPSPRVLPGPLPAGTALGLLDSSFVWRPRPRPTRKRALRSSPSAGVHGKGRPMELNIARHRRDRRSLNPILVRPYGERTNSTMSTSRRWWNDAGDHRLRASPASTTLTHNVHRGAHAAVADSTEALFKKKICFARIALAIARARADRAASQGDETRRRSHPDQRESTDDSRRISEYLEGLSRRGHPSHSTRHRRHLLRERRCVCGARGISFMSVPDNYYEAVDTPRAGQNGEGPSPAWAGATGSGSTVRRPAGKGVVYFADRHRDRDWSDLFRDHSAQRRRGAFGEGNFRAPLSSRSSANQIRRGVPPTPDARNQGLVTQTLFLKMSVAVLRDLSKRDLRCPMIRGPSISPHCPLLGLVLYLDARAQAMFDAGLCRFGVRGSRSTNGNRSGQVRPNIGSGKTAF